MRQLIAFVFLGCIAGGLCDARGEGGILGLRTFTSGRGTYGGGRFGGVGTQYVSGGGRFGGLGTRFISGGGRFGGLGARYTSGGRFGGLGTRFVSGGSGLQFLGGGGRRFVTTGGGLSGVRIIDSGAAVGRTSPVVVTGGNRFIGQGSFSVDNFANIDASAFGFDNFGRAYVALDSFDFNTWRNNAAGNAPRASVNAGLDEQVVIGSKYSSGFARQSESSSANKQGSGSGTAGIELTASRSATQDATQAYTQQASGEGKTEQGATYEYSGNPRVAYQPVRVESLPAHSGPRSLLPQ